MSAATDAVASRVCRCKRAKGLGTAFCYTCWHRLPVAVQRKVYPPGGLLDAAGYVEACRALELREGRRAAASGGEGG